MAQSTVFVSVIMPVRNEEAFIDRSLEAVLNQDYPAEAMEILMADGLSNDRTLDIIQALPGAERVRIIPNPQRIQAAGLNKALQHAQGDVIIRVDGHTVIAPDYVRQCVTLLQETGAYTVGGSIAPVGITSLGKAIACASRSPFAVPGAFHTSQTGQYTDTVYMGAWPRRVFELVGGFDERLPINEDYELNYRIRQAGGRIYFSPQIRSEYFGRQTFRALAWQYFHYGKGKIGTLRKHPASLRPRQLAAPTFVSALVGGVLLALIVPPVWIFWLCMLLVYLAAALFFSFTAARQAHYTLFWNILLVFIIIHLTWGAGFWAGFLENMFHRTRGQLAPSPSHQES